MATQCVTIILAAGDHWGILESVYPPTGQRCLVSPRAPAAACKELRTRTRPFILILGLATLLAWLWLVPHNGATAEGADPPATETAPPTQTLDATLTPTDTPTPTATQTPDFTATPSATPSPTATGAPSHSLYLPFVNRIPPGAIESVSSVSWVYNKSSIIFSWLVDPSAKVYQLWHSLHPDMSDAELLYSGLLGGYLHGPLPFGVHYYRIDALNMWGAASSPIIHHEIVGPSPTPTLTPLPPTVTPVPWTDMTWTPRAIMPTARYNFSAAVADGKIYVIGGLLDPGTSLDAAKGPQDIVWPVVAYDPVSNTWASVFRLPYPIYNAATVAVAHKIYLIGGQWADYSHTSEVEVYNPALNDWRPRARMSVQRASMGAAAIGEKIYVAGGSGHHALYNTLEVYDVALDRWQTLAPMLTARESLGVAAVNGKIYAIGGGDEWTTAYNTVEEYDPATNTWRTRAPMPTARTSLQVVAGSNGKLYAIGGCQQIGCPQGELSTVEEYDPASDTWRLRSNMRTGRAHFAAVAGPNGRLYVMGGISVGLRLDTVEEGTLP